ncbi:Uncharacterized protein TCM_005291 [Theobroma cacao]|uniref:Uncharacterized protein n=1 Tax=Theobroma cacao TaxID=3641 RepID=A0A061DU23_THECC|nr:Uncharacterized protein TCM_005291 [Theobroma cacao]
MSRPDRLHPRLEHFNQTCKFHGATLSLISLSKGRSPNPAMIQCWLARVRATDDFLFVMSLLFPLPHRTQSFPWTS